MKSSNTYFFDIKIILIICLIFSFRTLFLFVSIPFFNTNYLHILNENNILNGIAVSAYSFSQAILQIPIGILSDKIGRKPVIVIGFLLFFIGNTIIFLHFSIWTFIFGRILQGSGATSSVMISLLFDLIKKENRTVAMIYIGISVFLTFLIFIIVESVIVKTVSLCNFYWFASIFSFLCILLIWFYIPNSIGKKIVNLKKNKFSSYNRKNSIDYIFKNKKLLKLNISAFIFNCILMSNLFAFPTKFMKMQFLSKINWKLYAIIILFLSIVFYYLILIIKRKKILYNAYICCIFFIGVSQTILYYNYDNYIVFFIGMIVFFFAYYVSYSFIPILIKELSLTYNIGMTMGVLNTFQFLGTAIGGSLEKFISYKFNINGVYFFGEVISFLWVFIIFLDSIFFKKTIRNCKIFKH